VRGPVMPGDGCFVSIYSIRIARKMRLIMLETEIHLTEDERNALQEISRQTGKSETELIHEALDDLIAGFQVEHRRAQMQKARGIWKDRQDLPALDDLRQEWDRL